jgi:hypothetical protein
MLFHLSAEEVSPAASHIVANRQANMKPDWASCIHDTLQLLQLRKSTTKILKCEKYMINLMVYKVNLLCFPLRRNTLHDNLLFKPSTKRG